MITIRLIKIDEMDRLRDIFERGLIEIVTFYRS